MLRDRVANGGTVLLSSHLLAEAAQTVDDVVVIDHGRLLHEGPIGAVDSLEDVYLELTGGRSDDRPAPRGTAEVADDPRPVGVHGGGIAFTVLNAVIVALASGTIDEVPEKEEALAGLPILLLLWGLVGAAGEYRHRTAAPLRWWPAAAAEPSSGCGSRRTR